MGAINSSKGQAWLAPQTAKGTPQLAAHASVREFSWAGGTMPDITKTNGEQKALDGRRFGARSRPIVVGIDATGAPRFQAQLADIAWMLQFGYGFTATVGTLSGGKFPWTIVPNNNSTGSRLTSWYSLGGPDTADSPAPIRQKGSDEKVSSLAIGSTTQDPFVVMTVGLEGLAIETFDTLPAASFGEVAEQIVHFDLSGSVNIDGVVMPLSSLSLTIDEPHQKWRGDSRIGRELVPGRGMIRVAFATLLDEVGMALWNKCIYGTATPAAGTEPSETVFNAEVSWTWTNPDTTESLTVTLPRVYFEAQGAPEGNVEGEIIEVAYEGEARRSDTDPEITVSAELVEGAFTLPGA